MDFHQKKFELSLKDTTIQNKGLNSFLQRFAHLLISHFSRVVGELFWSSTGVVMPPNAAKSALGVMAGN
jgi:hypothetical protein